MFCQYIFKQGKKEGKQCTTNGNYKVGKKHYCCRHMNSINNMKKAKNISARGFDTKQVKAQQKNEEKGTWSMFFITINSNKNIENMDDIDKNKFKRFINWLYDDAKILDMVTCLKDKNKDDCKDLINNYEIENYFEVSPKSGNKLHNHSIVRLKHNSMLQIDQELLRSMAKDILGTKMYINIKGSRDNHKIMQDYIKKGQMEQPI